MMVENEIQYIPVGQFRQMVPPILGLEVRRLSRWIARQDPDSDIWNQFVKVRYELSRFIACIEASKDLPDCEPFLDAALLNAVTLHDYSGMEYVIDRLRYVRDRIPYTY